MEKGNGEGAAASTRPTPDAVKQRPSYGRGLVCWQTEIIKVCKTMSLCHSCLLSGLGSGLSKSDRVTSFLHRGISLEI